MSSQWKSVLLVALMIGSVVGAGVTFVGTVAAADMTVSINEISGETIDGTQSEQFVSPSTAINLNYTLAPTYENKSITSATVKFESVNENRVVEREVTADAVTNRVEEVQAPAETGFYEVTLQATDETGVPGSDSVTADGSDGLSGFLVVQTEDPTVNINSPSDGDAGGYPMIEGTAYDGAGIDNVTMMIRNESSGNYWNGTAWKGEETWFEVTNPTPNETYGKMVGWSYDVYQDKAAFDAGEYTIAANAHNGLGESLDDPTKEGPPSAEDDEDTAPSSVTFELVVSPAVVESVEFPGMSESVHEATNDSLSVNVTVDPRGTDHNSVGPAQVESSDLGIDASTLDKEYDGGADRIYFTGDVSLGEPTVSEGTAGVAVTVNTSVGTASEAASITLERAPASVEDLGVDAEFVGTIHDEANSIPLTVSGVRDADGNPLSENGALDVVVDGTTVASGLNIENGDVTTDNAIDPSDLGPDNTAGQASLEVEYNETGDVIASGTVTLVHEVYGLEANTYQPAATPMPANDILIDSAGDKEVLTWDPATQNWTGVENPTAAGTGYMITPGDDDDARIGYEFVTSESQVNTRHQETLEAGTGDGAYHLLGATKPLTDADRTLDTETEWEADLVDSETEFATGTAIDVYAPSGGNTLATGQDPPISWTRANADNLDSISVDEYGAYWVQLDEDDVDDLTRVFNTQAYNKSERASALG